MTKLFKSVLASFALIAGQANAAAVVYDFERLVDETLASYSDGIIDGQYADGHNVTGYTKGERAFNYFDWDQGGLVLHAEASYDDPSKTYSSDYFNTYGTEDKYAYKSGESMKGWAYLDEGNAGLGVCHAGLKDDGKGSNQCDPGGDDNVTMIETLMISFNEIVSIDFLNTVFRNGGHGIIADPMVDISLDGGSSWNNLVIGDDYISSQFYFRVSDDNNQFYIDALSVNRTVPEPQALLLMMLGLAGLIVARRNQA